MKSVQLDHVHFLLVTNWTRRLKSTFLCVAEAITIFCSCSQGKTWETTRHLHDITQITQTLKRDADDQV